ncbi:MAG: NADH:flavin oxidoreductase [Chloroflexaceae bacterium]|nr:NADH:flavin oxidoreductase [Chloroflexaceae bacterium]
MAHLFSPFTIAGVRLPNRIVMSPSPSGFAMLDGFVNDALYKHYVERSHGGVGLIITEPIRVIPPHASMSRAHVGIYADAFIPRLRQLAEAVHGGGAGFLLALDAPADLAFAPLPMLANMVDYFLQASWRALAAGCDGVMLSSADGGLLHALVSPLVNTRQDEYGLNPAGRLRLVLEIVEGIRSFLGHRLLIGFRLVAEEFQKHGIELQDARLTANRVAAAGVNVLDVTADVRGTAPIARFPGWRVPLANGIKRVLPDVPVIASGRLGDPHLADSVIRDGSVDLVMLGRALRDNPYWPHLARIILMSSTYDHHLL